MRRKILRIGISLSLLLLTVFSHAFADRIQDYHVDITILEDGKIDVVETIKVSTSHQEIRLGITRNIPLYYYLGKKKIETPVQLLSVTRNGETENHWIEKSKSKINILTGARENVRENYLPIGSHTYVIHWQSDNHIRRFQKYDELYLNAIGTNWELPIEKASATIYLPESVEEIQSAGYYGRAGETTRALVEVISPREIYFTIPKSLAKYEGLTVSTGFTPGIVTAVKRPIATAILEEIQSYLPLLIPLPIVVLGAALLLFLYWCIGTFIFKIIQPKSHQAFMVRFQPPTYPLDKIIALFSPRLGKGSKQAVLAILMSLASKNRIKLSEESETIILLNEDVRGLSEAEKNLVETLLRHEGEISYERYHQGIAELIETSTSPIVTMIKQFYKSPMRLFNFGALALFSSYAVIYSNILHLVAYFILIFIACGSSVVLGGILMILKLIHRGRFEDFIKTVFMAPILIGMGSLFVIMPMSMVWPMFSGLEMNGFTTAFVINTLALGVSVLLLLYVVTLYTKFTKVIREEYVDERHSVLEFEHFLRYTKKEEYAILRPDIFEEYLAYAIIFGVEKQWLALFKAKFPEEYQRSQHHGHISSFSIMSSRSFTSSMTAPRSSSSGGGGSSGSGGGGSSGGGSGGGGGGGR